MEACWNKLVLDRPPTTSWRCLVNEFDTKNFVDTINEVIGEFDSQMILHTEAAILSRLIYRMKSKLRNDKGLKNMEKINRALLNYLKISLEKEYEFLKDNVECDGDVHVLPSRQMLQYVLVRTQGFAKLMCRIESVAKSAGEFFQSRLNLGHAWSISVVAYAVISRIWLLSRYLAKRCCRWYSKMYKFLYKLKMTGVSWLPNDYNLPMDLKVWIDVPWIDDDLKSLPTKIGFSDSIFNLITQHRDEEQNADLDVIQGEDRCISTASPAVKPVGITAVKETPVDVKSFLGSKVDRPPMPLVEIGERINRDLFVSERSIKTETPKVKRSKKRKIVDVKEENNLVETHLKQDFNGPKKVSYTKSKKKKIIDPSDIKTKEDVTKFLSFESYPGLDKKQWKILRKNTNKLLFKLNKSDGISSMKKQNVLLNKIIRSIQESIN